MNILILDDEQAKEIRNLLLLALHQYCIYNKINFFLAKSVAEADKIYADLDEDIDIAIIDYDLGEKLTGLSTKIVEDLHLHGKQRVILVLSQYYDAFEPYLKSLVKGYDKKDFDTPQDIAVKDFIEYAIDKLQQSGRFAMLRIQEKDTLFKVSDILAIAYDDAKFTYLCPFGKEEQIRLNESGVEDIYLRVKEADTLVQINQRTIVNRIHYKSYRAKGNPSFAYPKKMGANLVPSDNYKNLL